VFVAASNVDSSSLVWKFELPTPTQHFQLVDDFVRHVDLIFRLESVRQNQLRPHQNQYRQEMRDTNTDSLDLLQGEFDL